MQMMNYEVPMGVSLNPVKGMTRLEDYIDCGFTHFEVTMPVSGEEKRGPAEMLKMAEPIVRAMQAKGICPWSIHLPFGGGWDVAHPDPAERARVAKALREIVKGVADWGVQVLTLHACLEPVQDSNRFLRILRSVESVCEIRDCADEWGMRVAVENLPRSCLGNSSEELLAILRAAGGGVGCCFDVNHLLIEDHRVFLDTLARQTITTHLSDYDGVDERHWLPGKGIVPFGLVMDRLQKAGYRGPYLFELGSREDGEMFTGKEILDAFRASLTKF